jgi:acyl transferase domain-containing protein
MRRSSSKAVAIIGMSGRFPGARNVAEFWDNLRGGVESISFYSPQELIASGTEAHELDNPYYVKAGSSIDDIEMFDAAFFGINPREAESMDPQQRLFLECAWEALEDAGYDPETYRGSIGVYAGCAMSSYLYQIYRNPDFMGLVGYLQILIGNDKDYLSTHASYKLNLKGPSINIQTTCSTSLVAVSIACKNLQNRECDMALAGGVCIRVPQKTGYLYEPGGIYSPDGHCRVFDAKADGVVFGNGVGVVLLKRLADAIADRDAIYAVIRGSAINNDGALKTSYTAPGLDGQTEVIAKAQAAARTPPGTITYIEAHGTGTALGDPVEIAALTRAFRLHTQKKNFCAIGSVKTNVGHLDHAAGVTGLIKTVLSLEHKMLLPSLNCDVPNPEIGFASSPFYVNTKLTPWKTSGVRRRAGVSAFGIGGTNVHVVVEEAPLCLKASPRSRLAYLLVLSARTAAALDTGSAKLAAHLKNHPDLEPPDVAYTSQVGRRVFHFRRAVVYKGLEDLVQALEISDPKWVVTGVPVAAQHPKVVFMFSGQGTQYVDMARQFYETETTFRNQVDACAMLLKPHLDLDLRSVLYPDAPDETSDLLNQTRITQPALFVIEYALSSLLMEWGLHPQAMIGHSIGEYVAACLSGCFSIEEALMLVAERGRLMQNQPSGSMLAVSLPETELRSLLGEELDIAAVNGQAQCVASGDTSTIEALETRLTQMSVACTRLRTSHAFHSRMMEPAVRPFREAVERMHLKPPKIPYVSTLTGTWISASQATSPVYWARHLREPVHFEQGIRTLLEDCEAVFLEVGPGQALSSLVRRHPARKASQLVLASMPYSQGRTSETEILLQTVGRLWTLGVQVDWEGFNKHAPPHRVHLPTYPFERQRYWVDVPSAEVEGEQALETFKNPDMASWFYVPSWKYTLMPETPSLSADAPAQACWLILQDEFGLGAALAHRLHQQGQDVITVLPDQQFSRLDAYSYALDPRQRQHFDMLFAQLRSRNCRPEHIVHLWTVSGSRDVESSEESVNQFQHLGFYSVLWIVQALIQQNVTSPVHMSIVSDKMHLVTGTEPLAPGVSTLLGVCKAVPQEYPNFRCRSIDITLSASGNLSLDQLAEHLLIELAADSSDIVVAYRGGQRWVQVFEPMPLEESTWEIPLLQEYGVYLITGGLGKIPLVLAEELVSNFQARVVLLGRSWFPRRREWKRWLADHGEADPMSNKIRRVIDMENMGGEVMILSADVADETQLSRAIDQLYARFGILNGAIHGAGDVSADGFFGIDQADENLCNRQFAAKIWGLLTLEKVLQREPLDFWLLLSSISSVLAGIGYVAYAAANAFMDAFAIERSLATGVPWISVDWDTWDFSETAEFDVTHPVILPEEGVEAFRRILTWSSVPQVVVSVSDLQVRINQWIKLQFLQKAKQTAAAQRNRFDARLIMGKEYVAPRNQIEQAIAKVWQDILGVDQVGVHDDFFTELNGSSLLATQLVARLRTHYQQDLPLRRFFEGPTVAELATLFQEVEQT